MPSFTFGDKGSSPSLPVCGLGRSQANLPAVHKGSSVYSLETLRSLTLLSVVLFRSRLAKVSEHQVGEGLNFIQIARDLAAHAVGCGPYPARP
jgi:hypothetical protein